MDTAIWIQAIVSFFLFGTTVLLVIANWNLVCEMKKDRKERMKPYVVARVCKAPSNHHYAYHLRIANLGGSPACDIKVSYRPDFSIKGPAINTLCQNDVIFTFMEDEGYFLGKPKNFEVDIEYKDRLGKLYRDTFKMGLSEARLDSETALVLITDDISSSLENISQKLR